MGRFRGTTNSRASNVYASAIANGHQVYIANQKARADAANKYSQALQKQKEYDLRVKAHELADDRFHYEKAKQLQGDISKKFPIGNDKSDLAYANFRLNQPDQYKALVDELKVLPGAVDDNGNINRLPAYEVTRGQLETQEQQLKDKVDSGQANPQEQMAYLQAKEGASLFKQATEIAKEKIGFGRLPSDEQTNIVTGITKSLIQARIASLPQNQNQGQLAEPVQQPAQPAQLAQQPGSFNATASPVGQQLVQNPQPIQQQQPQGTQTNQATQIQVPNYKRLT